MSIRVRFAPSPTGHLHIGSARTALFNYLFARQNNGKYILRIEDTDLARNKDMALEGFITGFKWLGLDWDEGPDVGGAYGPYSCMERVDIYKEYIDKLLASGAAYKCYCTQEELDLERAQHTGNKPYRYSGKCRALSGEAELDKPFTIRFRVPDNQVIQFKDLVRGNVSFNTNDIGDFIVVKSNGIPVYNMAVTIDDALMKITHVIRGEEHLSNTPQQILLYNALGWTTPTFAHLPLILNSSGQKLSKRDESIVQFIEQYQELGYLPEAINNYLALLGWSPPEEHKEEELFNMAQLEELFSMDRIGKSGAIFDPEKLRWINAQHIRLLPTEQLTQLVLPYLQEAYPKAEQPQEWYEAFVALYQPSLATLKEFVTEARLFLAPESDLSYDLDAEQLLKEAQSKEICNLLASKLQTRSEFTLEEIQDSIKQVQKNSNCKGKQLFMPIRAALTGQLSGADLKQSMLLIGKENVISRLSLT